MATGAGVAHAGASGDDSDVPAAVAAQDPGAAVSDAEHGDVATVSRQDGAELRNGRSEVEALILTMPKNATIKVLEYNDGWYKVGYDDHVGWASADQLSVLCVPKGDATGCAPEPQSQTELAIAQAVARAKSGLGFSYHWGGGCWKAGAAHGSCSGNCPDCTHSGTWGADCSGYVAKIWQVPHASAVDHCEHPFQAADFARENRYWNILSASTAPKQGDAFASSTHTFFVKSYNSTTGKISAYEAKGCRWGIISSTRTRGSYKLARHEGW
jgi:hypothetical protein